jgi:hypothetical protein
MLSSFRMSCSRSAGDGVALLTTATSQEVSYRERREDSAYRALRNDLRYPFPRACILDTCSVDAAAVNKRKTVMSPLVCGLYAAVLAWINPAGLYIFC